MNKYLSRKDFFFDLPSDLIAQVPTKNRSDSKLMVLDEKNIEHKNFRDIINYLNPGDCLVLNNTRVIPARLIGFKNITNAKIEVLLLKKLGNDLWECLIKPGRKFHIGDEIDFGNGILKVELIKINDDGNRIIKFLYDGIFEEILDELGEMPLPPYIKTKLEDKQRYQTVYAKYDGSAAAPTAGLHFTNELLSNIKNKGVNIAYLTLHVGLGTFRPVKSDNVFEHKMHSEFFILNDDSAKLINDAKRNSGKIIAVGTTSCRTLESCADKNGFVSAKSGWTDIFIYPGYKFKIVDELITNFHLPESTLIMLVSAFHGREKILHAYKQAIKNKYKFFSFGDAMFIKSKHMLS